ncbi:flavodoxin domain-containing protein [Cryobacterium sp. 10I1]|uniref:flavodoxin family protein n=1 Tax=unclassified Cryobacterium TaxID=2649013 RepID=UPI002B231BD4|nr:MULTISPECIES: flavodoxin domain-containing protein [unclassified Cryobacterium]MEB0202494.1 flavodoxin domain-containing protein [Cryobacterium sp. 5I3]MEB0304385.1 flavodoxin domain-containing protein [Cryobacterium sp. 10I1]
MVYESIHGRTQQVAESIASGLSRFATVRVLSVNDADPDTVGEPDLLVVGAPDHWSGLSLPEAHADDIREAQNASDPAATVLPPGAISMREWFTELPPTPTLFAVFETRTRRHLSVFEADTQIQHVLDINGFTPVMPPEIFFLSTDGEFEPGELNRAKTWGTALATTTYHQHSGGRLAT